MPLAIELAAARTRMLSVSEIAARLDDRFGLLRPISRGGPARHRTLSAVIDWSYDLLTEPERALFDRLSVFAGEFGLAAAEAVADPGDDAVERQGQLIDKSLVLRAEGIAPPIRARLLYGAAAFALAQGDLDRATEAGRECLELSRGHDDNRAAGWGSACLGLAAWARGDYHSGRTFTEQAVALARRAGDRWHAAMGLAHLGRVAADQGDVDSAATLLEESAALSREVGYPMAIGFALDLLAILAYRQGRDAHATALAEQALWAYRAGGSPRELIGSALRTIGLVACRRGDDQRAAAVHLERLTLYRRLGIRGSVVACLEDLADVAAARDQPVQAVHLLAAAQAMRNANGTPLPGPERDHHYRRLAAVRAVLDAQDLAAAWTAGQAMTLDSALNEAKALGARGTT